MSERSLFFVQAYSLKLTHCDLDRGALQRLKFATLDVLHELHEGLVVLQDDLQSFMRALLYFKRGQHSAEVDEPTAPECKQSWNGTATRDEEKGAPEDRSDATCR